MKTSKALKKTLKLLWDGCSHPDDYHGNKCRFICVASDIAEVGQIVRPIIENLLGGSYCYEDWIAKQFNMTNREKIRISVDMVKLQYSRKLWLEHLIQHYESIGD